VAENGSIFPQRHHTTCGQRGGRPKFNHGQMMADRERITQNTTGKFTVKKMDKTNVLLFFP